MEKIIEKLQKNIEILENENKQLKAEISWLKQMNKGLVELSMEVLRGANNE